MVFEITLRAPGGEWEVYWRTTPFADFQEACESGILAAKMRKGYRLLRVERIDRQIDGETTQSMPMILAEGDVSTIGE